eukprot:m.84404 g.84404  ORF g.84404 m.84404 type:complete len:655 (+) comp12744_c0_seq6:42-2006(+)
MTTSLRPVPTSTRASIDRLLSKVLPTITPAYLVQQLGVVDVASATRASASFKYCFAFQWRDSRVWLIAVRLYRVAGKQKTPQRICTVLTEWSAYNGLLRTFCDFVAPSSSTAKANQFTFCALHQLMQFQKHAGSQLAVCMARSVVDVTQHSVLSPRKSGRPLQMIVCGGANQSQSTTLKTAVGGGAAPPPGEFFYPTPMPDSCSWKTIHTEMMERVVRTQQRLQAKKGASVAQADAGSKIPFPFTHDEACEAFRFHRVIDEASHAQARRMLLEIIRERVDLVFMWKPCLVTLLNLRRAIEHALHANHHPLAHAQANKGDVQEDGGDGSATQFRIGAPVLWKAIVTECQRQTLDEDVIPCTSILKQMRRDMSKGPVQTTRITAVTGPTLLVLQSMTSIGKVNRVALRRHRADVVFRHMEWLARCVRVLVTFDVGAATAHLTALQQALAQAKSAEYYIGNSEMFTVIEQDVAKIQRKIEGFSPVTCAKRSLLAKVATMTSYEVSVILRTLCYYVPDVLLDVMSLTRTYTERTQRHKRCLTYPSASHTHELLRMAHSAGGIPVAPAGAKGNAKNRKMAQVAATYLARTLTALHCLCHCAPPSLVARLLNEFEDVLSTVRGYEWYMQLDIASFDEELSYVQGFVTKYETYAWLTDPSS